MSMPETWLYWCERRTIGGGHPDERILWRGCTKCGQIETVREGRSSSCPSCRPAQPEASTPGSYRNARGCLAPKQPGVAPETPPDKPETEPLLYGASALNRRDAEIARLTLRWTSEPPKVLGTYMKRWTGPTTQWSFPVLVMLGADACVSAAVRPSVQWCGPLTIHDAADPAEAGGGER